MRPVLLFKVNLDQLRSGEDEGAIAALDPPPVESRQDLDQGTHPAGKSRFFRSFLIPN